MKHLKLWLGLALIVSVGLYVADFYLERWVHYKMSYESLVHKSIKDMVKPECLQ